MIGCDLCPPSLAPGALLNPLVHALRLERDQSPGANFQRPQVAPGPATRRGVGGGAARFPPLRIVPAGGVVASLKSLPRTPGAPSGSPSSEWSRGSNSGFPGAELGRALPPPAPAREQGRPAVTAPGPDTRSWGHVGNPHDRTLGFGP